ncbi:MBL fold metallo-hydrolase [Halapricum desulfuricans]|uniref:Metal-dependent hydrolase of the beta-lactamase superfamily n=1 Tax=Halapricum desulfuricans TaxID=2841257 RepID=A0A897N067_9EURY|nr:MBL fold metallo-hydrolase [Halapricum desulfuricans]QSG06077.1 Metal-dependent hydrolase of the beta-lactamase superfamily [Halapricum desulfuricans]
MDVTFLGTGSAMPTGDRFQTGLLLEAGSDRLLVDCGSGVLHALQRTEAGYEGVDTVLLTHHHLDHVSDLLALLKARWLAGEDSLAVAGPPGTSALVDGLLDVHEYLDGRIELAVRDLTGEPFSLAGFDGRTFETRHSMQCFAYRLTHPESDAAFVFSGDSAASRDLLAFADGADVLVHDCSFPDSVETDTHATPTQLGRALRDAGAEFGRVYLTHLYPHTDGNHEAMLETVSEYYDGEVRFAADGTTVGLG